MLLPSGVMFAGVVERISHLVKQALGGAQKQVVLCADDDDEVRAICVAALKRAGFAVDVASDGRQTLEKLERRRYSAVLLDLGLPYIHGATVLSVMRQKDPAILRRLIVITGMNEAGLADIEPHVNTVLRKPIGIKNLVNAVRDCCAPETLVMQRG